MESGHGYAGYTRISGDSLDSILEAPGTGYYIDAANAVKMYQRYNGSAGKDFPAISSLYGTIGKNAIILITANELCYALAGIARVSEKADRDKIMKATEKIRQHLYEITESDFNKVIKFTEDILQPIATKCARSLSDSNCFNMLSYIIRRKDDFKELYDEIKTIPEAVSALKAGIALNSIEDSKVNGKSIIEVDSFKDRVSEMVDIQKRSGSINSTCVEDIADSYSKRLSLLAAKFLQIKEETPQYPAINNGEYYQYSETYSDDEKEQKDNGLPIALVRRSKSGYKCVSFANYSGKNDYIEFLRMNLAADVGEACLNMDAEIIGEAVNSAKGSDIMYLVSLIKPRGNSLKRLRDLVISEERHPDNRQNQWHQYRF